MAEIIFWAALFVFLVIVELGSMQLISIWLAFGSLAALICATFKMPMYAQFIIFVIVSIILLIATKPLVKKFQKVKFTPTNSELNVGKIAVVIQDIDNANVSGRVRLNDIDWAARSSDNSLIEKGATVVVKKISGSKLIVEKTN